MRRYLPKIDFHDLYIKCNVENQYIFVFCGIVEKIGKNNCRKRREALNKVGCSRELLFVAMYSPRKKLHQTQFNEFYGREKRDINETILNVRNITMEIGCKFLMFPS